MKKLLLSMALAAAVIGANAQDNMMSKNGTPILPEVGDWSVGFDVVPVISDFGNMFRAGGNNNLSQMPLTLVGLHVVDANTLYRMRVGINFGSTDVTQGAVADSLRSPSELKVSTNNFLLGFGIQKSMGKGRVHGIYGVELQVNFGGTTDSTFSYAKPVAATDVVQRETEDKTGSTFGLGLNGFAGVEYFFAAKASLSAEYRWGLNFSSTSAGTLTVESANGVAVTTTSYTGAKNSSFNLGVTDPFQIILHFYF